MAELVPGVPDALASSRVNSGAEILLSEYEETPFLQLSDTALASLRAEVNRGKVERIEAIFNEDGAVSLKATQYVGVVSLRDGPTIEIRPKAAGTHLLHLLRYAQGVSTTTIDRSVSLQTGSTFIDAIGYLFASELETVLNRGLHSEYQRVSREERHLRGRLDVQRQLQRQQQPALKFECEYDELTTDTLANRAILYATIILLRLVQDPDLRQSLQRSQFLLRRQATLTPVSPAALARVELTRLNDHYADALRLTELVLRNHFVRELRGGGRESFALLVDMNQIFERVVERAMRAAVRSREGWTVDAQHSSRNLITGGKHTVTIRPDILLRDSEREVRCIGDAKWKLGSPSNGDFYQLASYQLAFDAPGLLVYPEQDGNVDSESVVAGQYPLSLVELPTRHEGESMTYEAYTDALENRLSAALQSLT